MPRLSRKCVHLFLGAITYYIIAPIYYFQSILNAAWLAYRLISTSRGPTVPQAAPYSAGHYYQENLKQHLSNIRQEKTDDWKEPANYANEMEYPIEVVDHETYQQLSRPAERISALFMHFVDVSQFEQPSRKYQGSLAVPMDGMNGTASPIWLKTVP
jgi:hypothetical protein